MTIRLPLPHVFYGIKTSPTRYRAKAKAKVVLTAEKAGTTPANARSRPRARARAKQMTDFVIIATSLDTSQETALIQRKVKAKAKQRKAHIMEVKLHGRRPTTVNLMQNCYRYGRVTMRVADCESQLR